MANDASNAGSPRNRRGSFTSQTFSNIFGRPSTNGSSSNGAVTSPFPSPITTTSQDTRRRMSLSTLGLSGTSPIQTSSSYMAANGRRTSTSTAGSDSIDENAIEDDDAPSRSSPTTPFSARRLSFGAQALRNARTGSMNNGTSGEGLNWSEHFRSRAESVASQQRPSFSMPTPMKPHDRAKSVSDMATPPMAVPTTNTPPLRKKPDAFGERMLKGDFYMD